jgi:hypothetical protein
MPQMSVAAAIPNTTTCVAGQSPPRVDAVLRRVPHSLAHQLRSRRSGRAGDLRALNANTLRLRWWFDQVLDLGWRSLAIASYEAITQRATSHFIRLPGHRENYTRGICTQRHDV